ncbi:Predicted arabinose efflux permease, MFS family [Klenkia marina]|uniref:Predicted arabinose efflux permease, MFS family n=1 Tax=Klenkia marina TaxID=1960309 RepID=A0A1G4YFX2_9ACTN|nr:MFS transporter [Klenkia marina]SCX52396.1 Predicted arabinose efflux permease, MFS family [Klenkia marina]
MTAPVAVRPRAWVPVALTMFAIGWGANQFVSLLVAYRRDEGLSTVDVSALVGVYALGLIPALLVLGPVSDARGRGPVLRVAAVVSVLATAVLLLDHLWALYAGRLLAGLASGAAFAAGSAWVRELSGPAWDPTTVPGTGAKRAATALSAGFGLGPLVAGLVAQWAPHPLTVAYLPHLVLALAVLVPLWRAPETVPRADTAVPLRRALRVSSVREPRFRRLVSPVAPWVFTAATVSLAVLPGLLVGAGGAAAEYAVAVNAVVAGLTLGTGVLVQPLARRLAAHDTRPAARAGTAAVAAGLLVAVGYALSPTPWLLLPTALLLGAGYGCCLVAGLLETQRVAAPHELAGLTGVFYALTYLGFAAPLVLAALTAVAPYPALLGALAALAVLTLAWTTLDRRTG